MGALLGVLFSIALVYLLGEQGVAPSLVAAAEDHNQCNRLVNEQTQVSLLLAGPGFSTPSRLHRWLLCCSTTPSFMRRWRFCAGSAWGSRCA